MIERKSFTSQMSALCPAIQCCQTFNNMDNLQTHLEMHPSHNIIESKSTLVFHTPKGEIESTKCQHCYRRFVSKETLSKHFCSGERENKCGICAAIGHYNNFKSSDELANHINTRHPQATADGKIWHRTGEWTGRTKKKSRAKLNNKNKSVESYIKTIPKATIFQLTMVAETATNNLADVLTPIVLKELEDEVGDG